MEAPLDAPLQALLGERDAVARLARRLSGRDLHSAEDIEQEVWAAALAHPPREATSLRGWLRVVTRTRAVERLRRRGRAGRAEREAARPEAIEGADEAVARRDQALRLARALRELGDPYREVLILRFVEELEPREVARRLRRPVETVRTQTRRGLLLLRRKLEAQSTQRPRALLAFLALLREPRRVAAALVALGGGAAVLASAWNLPEVSRGGVGPARAGLERAAAGESLRTAGVGRQAAAAEAPEPAPAPPRTSRWIDVELTDGAGRGFPGVEVSVAGPAGERPAGRTDGYGRLRVPLDLADLASAHAGWLLAGDAAELVLRAPELAAVHAFVFLPESGGTRVSTALTQPGRSLCGRILDDLGRPVAGAEVQAAPAAGSGGRRRLGPGENALAVVRALSTQSDAQGRFVLEGLPRENLHVFARANGHALATMESRIEDDGIEIALVPAPPLRGELRLDGRPAADALVGWEYLEGPAWPSAWRSARSDAAGRFSLPRPERGSLALTARQGAASARGVVELGTQDTAWSAELVSGTPWSVRLLEPDGRPAAGLYLNLRCASTGRLWGAAETDADGRATFAEAQAGPGDLVVLPARAAGTWPRQLVRALEPDGAREIVVRLAALPSAHAALRARFAPGTHALLLLEHLGGGVEQSAAPDARGELAWRGLPPGRWRARLEGEREIDLGEFELVAGATHDLGRIE